MRLLVFLWLFCFPFGLYANEKAEQHEIQLRIQPVGKVSVQSQTKSARKITHGVGTKKRLGQEIYERYCIVCHRDGLAGAPRFRNEQDWKPRLANKTLNNLFASSLKGINAMPIKGTCIKCSDEDLKAAISYMLPRS